VKGVVYMLEGEGQEEWLKSVIGEVIDREGGLEGVRVALEVRKVEIDVVGHWGWFGGK
jgi:hypothetical protein